MIEQPTVSRIVRDDEGRYTWTVTAWEWQTDTMGTTRYRTNAGGEGLWVWTVDPHCWIQHADRSTEPVYEWKQIAGTCQFDLNCSPSTRRRRVVSRFLYTH